MQKVKLVFAALFMTAFMFACGGSSESTGETKDSTATEEPAAEEPKVEETPVEEVPAADSTATDSTAAEKK